VFIVLVLIVLSLMFGGFQKGTKENGLAALHALPAFHGAYSVISTGSPTLISPGESGIRF
jgi:hypothetical protein